METGRQGRSMRSHSIRSNSGPIKLIEYVAGCPRTSVDGLSISWYLTKDDNPIREDPPEAIALAYWPGGAEAKHPARI